MKVPKKIRTYCPKCRSHTAHTVSLYKKGRPRSLAEGNRRYERKKKGYGSTRKPRLKRTAKLTTKQVFKIKCPSCGYTIHRRGIRVKKVELVEKL